MATSVDGRVVPASVALQVSVSTGAGFSVS